MIYECYASYVFPIEFATSSDFLAVLLNPKGFPWDDAMSLSEPLFSSENDREGGPWFESPPPVELIYLSTKALFST